MNGPNEKATPITDALRTRLDERAFYDHMQAYRHAAVADQPRARARFEDVKTYLVRLVRDLELHDGRRPR